MKNLRTDDGLSVEVVRPGKYNTGAGPDFFNAQLRLDGTLWAGNVEIHIHSSDWRRHQHHTDPAYENCILHVVHENDSPTLRMNGTTIPVIELKEKYPPYLWDNYLRLIGTRGWIACQPRIREIDDHTWKVTKERMIEERIEQKSDQILIALKGNKDDWEECFYQQLARNFGFQLNAIPFEMLARSLPLKIISKERSSLSNVEALVFGQAGMLEENFTEDYPKLLKETYSHLSKKYSLKNIPVSSWKFLRLRPVNFPTIRLAQISALLTKCPAIFRNLTDESNFASLYSFFETEASFYWNTHYTFKKESTSNVKKLGHSSINNLIINSCIPFLYAWGRYTGDAHFSGKAMALLGEIPAEENHVISKWKELGIKVHNAVDTQALLQLNIQHCSEKKCLTCSIGNQLINTLP